MRAQRTGIAQPEFFSVWPKGALDARVCDVVSSCLFQTNPVYATVLSLPRAEVEQ